MTQQWISVDKKQPEEGEYVLVNPPHISSVFPDEPRHVLRWHDGRFVHYMGDSVHCAYNKLNEVDGLKVRWMPLPEIPED